MDRCQHHRTAGNSIFRLINGQRGKAECQCRSSCSASFSGNSQCIRPNRHIGARDVENPTCESAIGARSCHADRLGESTCCFQMLVRVYGFHGGFEIAFRGRQPMKWRQIARRSIIDLVCWVSEPSVLVYVTSMEC
jgi:hypothetical protein